MKQLAHGSRRPRRIALAATIWIAAPLSVVAAQSSQPVSAPWWPSSVENRVSSLALFGNVMQCTIGRCDHAASLGADMRVAGPLHVAVDARAPGLDYSAWYGWRRVSIGATVGRGATIGPPTPSRQVLNTTMQADTGGNTTVDTQFVSSKHDAVRWSSAAARLTWREDRWWATALLGRVTVAGQGGAVWGGLQLGADVGRGVSLLLGAGTSTRLFALAAPEPGRRNLNLGLGFNTSILSREPSDAPKTPIETRTAFDVSSVSVDRVRITIRAPAATTIEFASDCTGWKPLAMTRERDGWVVEIAALRGLHRANIRVDSGHWIAPPGLASADDDFAGEVGIFVVE